MLSLLIRPHMLKRCQRPVIIAHSELKDNDFIKACGRFWNLSTVMALTMMEGKC